MKEVQTHIDRLQQSFAQHPFFKRLQRREPPESLRVYVPTLAFWVMTFQDVLRLNEARIADPFLKKVARHHRAEDSGHDRWFVGDMQELGLQALELNDLFAARYANTREAAFSLVAELYRADADIIRIAFLLALEAAGHVFFEHTAGYYEAVRADGGRALKYFSRHHIDVEKAHAMFEDTMDAQLHAIVLSPDQRLQAHAMVDRVHAAFVQMFDGVEANIRADSSTSAVA